MQNKTILTEIINFPMDKLDMYLLPWMILCGILFEVLSGNEFQNSRSLTIKVASSS